MTCPDCNSDSLRIIQKSKGLKFAKIHCDECGSEWYHYSDVVKLVKEAVRKNK